MSCIKQQYSIQIKQVSFDKGYWQNTLKQGKKKKLQILKNIVVNPVL